MQLKFNRRIQSINSNIERLLQRPTDRAPCAFCLQSFLSHRASVTALFVCQWHSNIDECIICMCTSERTDIKCRINCFGVDRSRLKRLKGACWFEKLQGISLTEQHDLVSKRNKKCMTALTLVFFDMTTIWIRYGESTWLGLWQRFFKWETDLPEGI